MLTEAEARTRWCPFARSWSDGTRTDVTTNRIEHGAPDKWCLCLASGCMAWRWAETAEFKQRAEAEFRRTGRRLPPDRGFCGLAGKSEL